MKRAIAITVLALMLLPLLAIGIGSTVDKTTPPSPIVYKTSELSVHKLIENQSAKKEVTEKERKVAEASIEEPVTKEVKAYSDDDLYWLSRIVSAEASGEPEVGQIAVANVVLNRVASNRFPDTIKGVIFAKGQFSPVSNGSLHKEPTKEAIESAKRALEGERIVSDDVLYFYEAKTATSKWSKSRKIAERIGRHTFTY